MVTITISCVHCGSEQLVQHGRTTNGKQRYLCKDCGRSRRANPQPNGYTEEEQDEILRAYEARSSLRGLTRTFGGARNTGSSWLKQKQRPSLR